MPADQLDTIFRRDLDRLPGLAEDDWVPRLRRSSPSFGLGHGLAAIGMIVLALVVGLSLQAIKNAHPGDEAGVATSSEPFFVEAQEGSQPNASPVAPVVAGPPICPRGQAPWLAVAHPPPPGSIPGTGDSGPEAAFRRARPTVSEYTMYKWGDPVPLSGPDDRRITTAPVWIVAGDETFVALVLGAPPHERNWFAYPAEFKGCMTPPTPTQRPSPTSGPVG